MVFKVESIGFIMVVISPVFCIGRWGDLALAYLGIPSA